MQDQHKRNLCIELQYVRTNCLIFGNLILLLIFSLWIRINVTKATAAVAMSASCIYKVFTNTIQEKKEEKMFKKKRKGLLERKSFFQMSCYVQEFAALLGLCLVIWTPLWSRILLFEEKSKCHAIFWRGLLWSRRKDEGKITAKWNSALFVLNNSDMND